MHILTDDAVLNIDGFLFIDPTIEMRQRAETFLISRQWSTSQVFYRDQAEPEDVVEKQPAWSMNFGLGLDHIKTTDSGWFSDVQAMLSFVQTLQKELENEFAAEVRFRSKPWYLEHITFVDEREINFATIQAMINRVV